MNRKLISAALIVCILLTSLLLLPACSFDDGDIESSPVAEASCTPNDTPVPSAEPVLSAAPKSPDAKTPESAQNQASIPPVKAAAPVYTQNPEPAAASTPQITYQTAPLSGYSLSMTVYVSSSGKMHTVSDCSGMKHYTAMTYGEACQKGYTHCKNCF